MKIRGKNTPFRFQKACISNAVMVRIFYCTGNAIYRFYIYNLIDLCRRTMYIRTIFFRPMQFVTFHHFTFILAGFKQSDFWFTVIYVWSITFKSWIFIWSSILFYFCIIKDNIYCFHKAMPQIKYYRIV